MRPLSALLASLLLLPASAVAAPQPSLYFLKDGPMGPVGEGLLNATVPNGTEPMTRPVFPGLDALVPVRFSTPPGEAHPDRLKGPLFVGLWLGESAIVHGNITATLYELKADGPAALGNASVALDLNASEVPDPASLVPPDPTDPQGAVLYIVSQALPLVLSPPVLLYLGIVDVPVDPASQFAIGFRLDAGSSPLPLPVGAAAQVQYDSILSPSFVYAPWYAPDPPRPSPTPRPSAASPAPTASATPPESSPPAGDGKDSPGAGLVAGLAALGAALVLARRRLL